jgi:choline monooxygenase
MTEIDEEIRSARSRRGSDYGDPAVFSRVVERVFARSWLPVLLPEIPLSAVHPFTLLPGALDEPVVCTRDSSGALSWLSNVCTHRGMIVACEAGHARRLRCVYHGRRFGLDGQLEAAPGFEDATDFPQDADNLMRLAHGRWGPLNFVGLDPSFELNQWLEPVAELLEFIPLDALKMGAVKTFDVRANWALYVDNYLEGFHIPTVHKTLAGALDVSAYETRLLPHGSVQVGIATDGEPTFDLPAGHPDTGRAVAAYYFHLFPSTMINAYPWGLSINHIEPTGPTSTRVRFVDYVWQPELRDLGAGADLLRVELEDEAVVEATQLGVRSRCYQRGRYAPRHERAVHHFHRLLSQA